MASADLTTFTAASPPFMKNGYVVSCKDTREAVIIDPGDEVDELLRHTDAERLTVTAILLTHAHLDHVTGVARAKARWPVPVWLHKDDLFLYDDTIEQGRMFGLDLEQPPPVDKFYQPGMPLRFGKYVV